MKPWVRHLASSRRVGAFLCLLGFVWGVTILNVNLTSSPEKSNEKLQDEILQLSEKYVKQLAAESQNTIDGPYAGRLTGYDLKKTLAVLLENVLTRLDTLEKEVAKVKVNSSAPLQDSSGPLVAEKGYNSRALEAADSRLQEGRVAGEGSHGDASHSTIAPVDVKGLILGAQEDCSLSPKETVDFPHCESKIDWMRLHWRSDPCYAQYGVDGNPCSFRVYLSEVEKWCPLLPGRRSIQFNKTGGDERVKAVPNVRLEGLLNKLRDPGQRQNYAWIRQRITRLWPGWVDGLRHLADKQNFTFREQKRVLVHLGLLSKKSGFKIAENSFKGGPLGELVQWSDVIASLYILGHDLVITSEVDQLAAILGKLPTAESQCQSREQLPLDMILTDIVGLIQFKKRVKSGYGKFSCLLRIIDSFGTEPAFNLEPFAKAHHLKTQWGMQNLIPQQFFTMFPHSSDNSFMGFVVEQHLNDSVADSGVRKKNQAVVYGKAEYMWQGRESYLSVIKRFAEIHATVFHEDNTPAILPSFVHNHGILNGPDLHQLLRESKLFIGLGFPYEGPAPLEAIAQGCVFINPRFDPPHNSQNTKFFKGKPTFRKVTSQHPYAEDFISKVNVRTVDINDLYRVEEVVREALQDIDDGKVAPYMPYEYTPEGMLQRVGAYIEHQDFCNAKQWPPDGAVRVILGSEGKSCQDVCRQHDLICEPAHFARINNAVTMETHLGAECTGREQKEDIYFPAVALPARQCFFQKERLLFSCVGELSDLARLCPCRDFLPGQTALCSQCL